METRGSTIAPVGSTDPEPTPPMHRRSSPTRSRSNVPIPAWTAGIMSSVALLIGIGLGYNVAQPTPWPAPPPVETPLPATPTGPPIKPMNLGDTILLGDKTGQVFTVTQAVDPAVAAHSIPSPGYRYLAVKLTVTNTTSSAWHADGVPAIRSVVISSDGKQYPSVDAAANLAMPFAADLTLPPDGTATGAVMFQVPATATVTGVQIALTPDAGAVGLWTIS